MKKLDKMALMLKNYDEVMLSKKDSVSIRIRIRDDKGNIQDHSQALSPQDKVKHNIPIDIKDDSIESLVLSKAKNLRALGHLMYTREPLSPTPMHISEKNAYYFLEQQRVENILTGKYNGMKKYFIYLTEKDIPNKTPVHLWGRRFFLPYKVEEPEEKPRDIIDKFLTSKSLKERTELAKEFVVYLPKDLTSLSPSNLSDSLNEQDSQDEERSSKSTQEKIVKEREERDKNQENHQDSQGKDGDMEKNNKRQNGDSNEMIESEGETPEGKGQDKAEGQGSNHKSESESEGSKPQSGSGVGLSSSPNISSEFEDMQDALDDMLFSAVKEVSTELSKFEANPEKKRMLQRKQGPGWSPFSVNRPLEKVNITPQSNLVDELYQVFRSTRIDLQGGWARHQKKGRIDLREAMTKSNSLKIFKKYEPSYLHESKISLVILYDISGSMIRNDPERIELNCVSALISAATKAGNEVCCISFDTYAIVVKGFGDSNLRLLDYNVHGGTDPNCAVEAFKKIKPQARYPIVLIILTDGYFEIDLKDMIDESRLYRILIGSHSAISNISERNQSGWIQISNMSTLPAVMKSILIDVEQRIKRRLGR